MSDVQEGSEGKPDKVQFEIEKKTEEKDIKHILENMDYVDDKEDDVDEYSSNIDSEIEKMVSDEVSEVKETEKEIEAEGENVVIPKSVVEHPELVETPKILQKPKEEKIPPLLDEKKSMTSSIVEKKTTVSAPVDKITKIITPPPNNKLGDVNYEVFQKKPEKFFYDTLKKSSNPQQMTCTPITLYKSKKNFYRGRIICTNDTYLVYCIRGGGIRIVNKFSAHTLLLRGHKSHVCDVKFLNVEESVIISSSVDNHVMMTKVFESRNDQVKSKTILNLTAEKYSADPDADEFGITTNYFKLLQISPTSPLTIFGIKRDSVYCFNIVKLMKDGVVNINDGKGIRKLFSAGSVIESAKFSPDGQYFATGLDNGMVNLYVCKNNRMKHSVSFNALPAIVGDFKKDTKGRKKKHVSKNANDFFGAHDDENVRGRNDESEVSVKGFAGENAVVSIFFTGDLSKEEKKGEEETKEGTGVDKKKLLCDAGSVNLICGSNGNHDFTIWHIDKEKKALNLVQIFSLRAGKRKKKNSTNLCELVPKVDYFAIGSMDSQVMYIAHYVKTSNSFRIDHVAEFDTYYPIISMSSLSKPTNDETSMIGFFAVQTEKIQLLHTSSSECLPIEREMDSKQKIVKKPLEDKEENEKAEKKEKKEQEERVKDIEKRVKEEMKKQEREEKEREKIDLNIIPTDDNVGSFSAEELEKSLTSQLKDLPMPDEDISKHIPEPTPKPKHPVPIHEKKKKKRRRGGRKKKHSPITHTTSTEHPSSSFSANPPPTSVVVKITDEQLSKLEKNITLRIQNNIKKLTDSLRAENSKRLLLEQQRQKELLQVISHTIMDEIPKELSKELSKEISKEISKEVHKLSQQLKSTVKEIINKRMDKIKVLTSSGVGGGSSGSNVNVISNKQILQFVKEKKYLYVFQKVLSYRNLNILSFLLDSVDVDSVIDPWSQSGSTNIDDIDDKEDDGDGMDDESSSSSSGKVLPDQVLLAICQQLCIYFDEVVNNKRTVSKLKEKLKWVKMSLYSLDITKHVVRQYVPTVLKELWKVIKKLHQKRRTEDTAVILHTLNSMIKDVEEDVIGAGDSSSSGSGGKKKRGKKKRGKK